MSDVILPGVPPAIERELGALLAATIEAAAERAAERAAARIEAALRPPPPTFLTIREAAELLRCSPRSLHRKLALGELTAQRAKSGGSARVLIARADVDRLLRGDRP